MRPLLLLCPILIALVGCKGSTALNVTVNPNLGAREEALVKENLDGMKELIATLETIKDKNTADEALPRLRKLAQQAQELVKKEKDVSAEELEKAKQKYKKELDEATLVEVSR